MKIFRFASLQLFVLNPQVTQLADYITIQHDQPLVCMHLPVLIRRMSGLPSNYFSKQVAVLKPTIQPLPFLFLQSLTQLMIPLQNDHRH